jgi:hypothetical protein
MFIPDLIFFIQDPGSLVQDPGSQTWIRIKEFKYFYPIKLILSLKNKIRDVPPGSRILDLDFFLYRIPDLGV